MLRLFTFVLIPILLLAGCGSPSTQGSKEPGNNGQTKQQKSTSNLKEKTVEGVTLKPSNPISGLEILIPAGFSKMDEDVIATKYPSSNRPNLVYTDEKGTINIAINHTKNKIAPQELTQLHQQLDMSIRQAQPDASWMFSGFQHHHGRKWTQLEFQSNAVDTKIHNMMMATSAKGRMLVISFNCTDEHASKWLKIGRNIINSAIFTE